MATPDSKYGARVRRARLEQGLTQEAFAEKVGTIQVAISKFENGKLAPGADVKEKLRSVLGEFEDHDSASRDEASEGSAGTSVFGEWLRGARTAAKLTVPELAKRSSVTPVQIYNLEAGRSRNPQARTRQALEDALEANVPQEVREEAEVEQAIAGLGSLTDFLTDFDPHAINELPSCAGVYAFYDVSDRPVYVGKGSNIGKRVRDHADKFWFKFPIVSHGAYVKIDDDRLRHQVEQVLIKFLKSNAVINRQSVDRDE